MGKKFLTSSKGGRRKGERKRTTFIFSGGKKNLSGVGKRRGRTGFISVKGRKRGKEKSRSSFSTPGLYLGEGKGKTVPAGLGGGEEKKRRSLLPLRGRGGEGIDM